MLICEHKRDLHKCINFDFSIRIDCDTQSTFRSITPNIGYFCLAKKRKNKKIYCKRNSEEHITGVYYT